MRCLVGTAGEQQHDMTARGSGALQHTGAWPPGQDR